MDLMAPAATAPKAAPKRVPALPVYEHPHLNVFEAALDRMRWIYREFDGHVTVSTSGGKDSTICVELAALASKELGYGPVRVYWLDQECELQATENYQRRTAQRDDVDFHWFQVPFDIDNSTSSDSHWFKVWDQSLDNATWARPKEPLDLPYARVYHENIYDQPQFYGLMSAISSEHFSRQGLGLPSTSDHPTALIDGMRTEESPARRMSMTSRAMYKWITWANNDADPRRKKDRQRFSYRFHPIYDWSYRDVWKAMTSREWDYNTIYNDMFNYGVGIQQMRVSSYTHENALRTLEWLQEVEPKTWEAATRRVQGINTYSHLYEGQQPDLSRLPYMFTSWADYAAHLMEHLPATPADTETYFKQWMRLIKAGYPTERAAQQMVYQVINGDLYGSHIDATMVQFRSEKRMERMLK